jgi:hypothetical protein
LTSRLMVEADWFWPRSKPVLAKKASVSAS